MMTEPEHMTVSEIFYVDHEPVEMKADLRDYEDLVAKMTCRRDHQPRKQIARFDARLTAIKNGAIRAAKAETECSEIGALFGGSKEKTGWPLRFALSAIGRAS
jgi:hypothetical protein